jgi:phenol 2-monooxygenase
MITLFNTSSSRRTDKLLLRVVGTFGSFQSGIGIRYESGPLINVAQQALASKLTIGERLPHAEIVNAADGLEHNLQDLAPSNFRYKVLLFAGDVSEEAQRKRLQAAATAVNKRFPQGKEIATRADVHVIGYGQDITDMSVHLQKLPGLDWYRCASPLTLQRQYEGLIGYICRSFADTANAFAPAEGKLHEAFGIDAQGAAIVVRPDGYVSAVGRLDASLEQTLAAYFDVYAA